MKKLILLVLINLTMFGCVSLTVKHIPIAGKDYTYVFSRNSNGISSLFALDRYDEKGNVLIHDSTNGSDPFGSFLSTIGNKAGSGLLLSRPSTKFIKNK